GAQEPRVIQADVPPQRQKQQIMPGPVADPVGETPPPLARQPAYSERQGGGDPDVELRPAFDKLPPPRQALQAIGAGDGEGLEKVRVYRFATMLGHQRRCKGGLHLQGGGRDRTGPHEATSSVATVSVWPPSARR